MTEHAVDTHSAAAAPAADLGTLDVREPVQEFLDALNTGDVEAAIAGLPRTHSYHTSDAIYGLEGLQVCLNMLRTWLPDLRVTVVDQQIDGEVVETTVHAVGTQTGEWMGNAPTGERIEWTSFDRAVVRDGQIQQRRWDFWTDKDLIRRYRITPSMAC